MKILVSAFACDPYAGSEPGIGWTAVCRIAREHDVFVLVDAHNKKGWKRGLAEGVIPDRVQVRFLREDTPYSKNRFIARLQSWFWYACYNRLVLKAAQNWHKEEQFDLCHQVTIATWRMPSPLWQLPIPFIWGPIGGAGYIPPAFRGMLSLKARLFERARDLSTACALRSKAFRNCLENTTCIFAANEETEMFLKPYRGNRTMVRLPIAPISNEKAEKFRRPEGRMDTSGPLRLFAGGNLQGSKGISIALRALARVKSAGVNFHYILAGGGPEISSLRKLCNSLGLDDSVEFHPGYQGAEYIAALQRSDLYFLPSFRETMGITLVEAILAGCYPVVADTSAQGEIVRLVGGAAIPITHQESLIQGLADAIICLNQNRSTLPSIAEQARLKLLSNFDSARYDQVINDVYDQALKHHLNLSSD